MLKSFDKKFSEQQFSTLVLFHENANLARYVQKTFFLGRGVQTHFKKAEGGYCGFLECSFGHLSTPLSAIRPLPAQSALFSLKSVSFA